MSKYAARRATALRPEKSSNSHTQRRQNTRRDILSSAQRLFLENSYFSVSVDDIAKAARISRAGFYLHYSSKEDILLDLVRDQSSLLDPLYQWFSRKGIHKPSRSNVLDFVNLAIRLARRSKRNLALNYHVTGYNPSVWSTFAENRRRHLDMLSKQIPAFGSRGLTSAARRKREAKATLILFQLEQLMVYATFAPDDIDVSAIARELSNTIFAFLQGQA